MSSLGSRRPVRPVPVPVTTSANNHTLRRPSSTMSLRTNPRTPVSRNFSNMGPPSVPSSEGSGAPGSRSGSRPSSSLSTRSLGTRPGSSMGRSSQRSGSSLGRRVSSTSLGHRGGSNGSMGPNSQSYDSYSGTIKVSVRPRPPTDRHRINWLIDSDAQVISAPDLGEFQYDNVYGLTVNNQKVYESAVSEIVSKSLAGFNGTVFAYGMTGSGKTYSMQGTGSDPGIIPLAAKDIFQFIDENQNNPAKKYSVKVSYLEIYNETINDLLDDRDVQPDLKIRDDPVVGVKVVGLLEKSAQSVDELLNIINKGDFKRKTGATDFNNRSSRSHAVVLIRINCLNVNANIETTSTLILCDLAGSEKATGQLDRRKEGAFINKSLLSLSSVISKLSATSTQKNVGHISYRDSKLTRLLQPALSGNAVISVLCTIQLTDSTHAETVNTLRFASKAKNVEVSVNRNQNSSVQDKDKLIEKLQSTIQKQKVEIELLKASNGLNSLNIDDPKSSMELAQLRSENRILTERVEHLTRLTEERTTESFILKNDIMNVLMSTKEMLDDTTLVRHLEETFKLQSLEVEEYKSYIAHLENELGKHEMKRYLGADSAESHSLHKDFESANQRHSSGSSDTVGSPIDSDSTSMSSDSPRGSSITLVSPKMIRNSVLANGSQRELQSLLEVQQEEIVELKESLKDKDRIIKALKTSTRFKKSLGAF